MRRSVFLLAILLSALPAMGQAGSFTISGGYAHLYPQKSGGLFFSRDGAYIDGDLSWRMRDVDFPLLLGAGLSGSGYFESRDVLFPFNNSFLAEANLQSDLGLFAIEARAAVPIASRRVRGLFIMPRLAAGLLIEDYSVDTSTNANGFTVFRTIEHTGAAFELRPTLQIGYSWGPGSIGAEVSYMAAWGDFGRLGSSQQELRAGVFVRLKF